MDKREILFRAWNKTDKYMDSDFSIHSDGCIYQPSKRTWDIADISIETAYDELEIMQFTGFYDKNGVNIFEEDIIKYVVRKRTKDHAYITKVIYKNGFIPLDNQSIFMGRAFLSLAVLQIEVIGNIYENPELLK